MKAKAKAAEPEDMFPDYVGRYAVQDEEDATLLLPDLESESPAVPIYSFLSPQEKEFFELLSVQSKSGKEKDMIDYVKAFLDREKIPGVSYTIDDKGNIFITKKTGKGVSFYPLLLAHMDTVHAFASDYAVDVTRVYQNNDPVILEFSSKTGIGGDDKCGIYLALLALRTFKNIKILFTVEEETGMHGAKEAVKNKEFFADVGYMVELDRKGNGDLITGTYAKGTQYVGTELYALITDLGTDFGYTSAPGSVSDFTKLQSEGINIAAFNMSVGYYSPHGKDEYINMPDVLNAFAFLKRIITKVPRKAYRLVEANAKTRGKELRFRQDGLYIVETTVYYKDSFVFVEFCKKAITFQDSFGRPIFPPVGIQCTALVQAHNFMGYTPLHKNVLFFQCLGYNRGY